MRMNIKNQVKKFVKIYDEFWNWFYANLTTPEDFYCNGIVNKLDTNTISEYLNKIQYAYNEIDDINDDDHVEICDYADTIFNKLDSEYREFEILIDGLFYDNKTVVEIWKEIQDDNANSAEIDICEDNTDHRNDLEKYLDSHNLKQEWISEASKYLLDVPYKHIGSIHTNIIDNTSYTELIDIIHNMSELEICKLKPTKGGYPDLSSYRKSYVEIGGQSFLQDISYGYMETHSKTRKYLWICLGKLRAIKLSCAKLNK